MAILHAAAVPADRSHLDVEQRAYLLRLELLLAQGKHEEAQEVAEELWLDATDAHKRLYQGLSNALTAVCARDARQNRGAREIARRTHAMLEDFPRRALGLDLDALLESVDAYLVRGEGPVLLLRQGVSANER